MEKPLINKTFLLQKYPGKGGWTYVAIPKIPSSIKRSFGMVKVKGSIDSFEFKSYNIMPMSSGEHFLPVKTEIRKKIKKEAGDTVKIILYLDQDPIEIPEEFLSCLKDESKAHKFFMKLSEGEKKYYVQWIYSAKKEETKIDRMAKAINRLLKSLKFSERKNNLQSRRDALFVIEDIKRI